MLNLNLIYLIHIKLGNDVVKEGVQIIEQFHNLVIGGDFAVIKDGVGW